MNKQFLSCDWGTSSLRLRLIDIASGSITGQLFAHQGTAYTYKQWKETNQEEKSRMDFYLAVIKQYSEKIIRTAGSSTDNIPIIVSGMASSSIGMLELPYTEMPFAVSGQDLQIKEIKKTAIFPHDIILVSGASAGTDVMRGEETQLIGCANVHAAGKQVFIFPGTHSKHIITSGGKAISVETFMTGEFFELLSDKSILSDSVEAGGAIEADENKTAFEQGVQESTRQNILHSSFIVRTNQLFKRYTKTANYFYLSGLMIGTELGQLPEKEVDSITIVGDKKLQFIYMLAIKLLFPGIKIHTTDDAVATIQGQLVIYKRVYGVGSIS